MSLALAFILASTPTQVSVAAHTPAFYFPSSTAKAELFTDLETSLSEALGVQVTVVAVQNPADLKKHTIWLTDAETTLRHGGRVVRQGRLAGKSTRPLALYAADRRASAAKLLGEGGVGYPGASEARLLALRYAVLLDEPGSAAWLKRLRGTRDIAATMTALAAGELKAAIVPELEYADLDPNFARLQSIATLPALPLPVVAVSSAAGSRMVKALEKAELPTISGTVANWGPAQAAAHRRVARAIQQRSSAISRSYALAPTPSIRMVLVPLLRPPPKPAPLNATVAMPAPSDPGLPELPYDAAPPPAVASRR